MNNLFTDLPGNLPEELTEILHKNDHVRIERIVSTGQTSPASFWYDQEETEWVIVLKGEAKLFFEDDDSTVHLKPGDYLLIPPHRKHRVEWTSDEEPTLWLAIFFQE